MRRVVPFSVAGMLLFFSAARADVPRLINYQGMLAYHVGTPLINRVIIALEICGNSLSAGEIDRGRSRLNLSSTG